MRLNDKGKFRLSRQKGPPAINVSGAAPFPALPKTHDGRCVVVDVPLAGSVRVVSPHLRVADVDGLILVMDLRTSAFFILDEDSSRMWHELQKSQGLSVAAKEALRSGDESARRLVGMFDDFVARCESRGFLLAGHPPQAHAVQRAPWPRKSRGSSLLTVRAWLSMLRMDVALRRHGFANIYERLGQAAGARPHIVDPSDVASARAAFLRAENFYVRRRAPNDCLPRSLALYAYMRRLGFPVVHHIGARRFPAFRSHAWVEYDGEPILDRRARVGDYTLIASV